MGLFIKLMMLLVVLAVALLFILKGPDGEPLMTVSDLKKPDTGLSGVIERLPDVQNPFSDEPPTKQVEKSTLSSKTQIYSWQDEQGNTHFTNQPPKAGQQATILQVNPNINVMPSVKAPEQEGPLNSAPVDESSGPFIYSPEGVNQVIQDAREIEGKVLQRNEAYDRTMNQ